ncbi:GMC family oxidoreductase [Craterilacuibacter sp. RT1T]|uniref:GMC family oxidoreductase n=1 Tax=Craterilacuibacter sp. RT1T TaxID=2942211 RepID=UPI0020BDE887|nr:GMC family oxidoreductase [Craterilacuibacter sp. RT1T]MCL6262970.1 GMC family oxidoreductase [Craterilacuibacter sp. RT1T]
MTSPLKDPIKEGLARGWQVYDGALLTQDLQLDCDVAIVGSGAGGGISAEVLAQAGLKVLLIEEGALKSSTDFRLLESEAYPQLYQESANRQTLDKGVTILQGRTVGGSTTVNWTSSFRPPIETLAWWRDKHGLSELSEEEMLPWIAKAEARVNIGEWLAPPNPNNSVLEKGCSALGYSHGRIRRNVRDCWNLGYCGMGCPTNAKQSMLVTTIPSALDKGAGLLARVRVERLLFSADNKQVDALEGLALKDDTLSPSGVKVRVKARHVLLCGGAIGTPALLLRSGAPDPHEVLGKRTFLHPVVLSGAIMPEQIEPWSGAPQTVYSNHFLHTWPIDGQLGYKLEVPPIHPVLLSTTLTGFGLDHARLMQAMPHLNVMLALTRDGFHPDSPGGTVKLKKDGSPALDYPITDPLWQAFRQAWHSMAELQFAGGAQSVLTVHENAKPASSLAEARAQIDSLPLEILRARVVSAHVMGGAAMSADASRGVVNHWGEHWQLGNVSVIDGSLFPTSIGANPQLSVYAFALRNASRLASRLARA